MTCLLRDKVIIITGAGSGIGAATARLCAEHGALLVLADVNAKDGEHLAAKLRETGRAVQFIQTNVALEDDARAMVAFTADEFGRLDGAFNNAGVLYEGKRIHELSVTGWQRLIDINLTGTFLSMKHQIEAMLRCGGGSIVNMSSVGGVVGSPNGPEYNAAKHGVIGLTRNGAIDYAKDGIRVNAVLPGFVTTPMMTEGSKFMPDVEDLARKATPLGRLAEPQEIAQTVVWMLSDASSYMTGAQLTVDGGFTAQ